MRKRCGNFYAYTRTPSTRPGSTAIIGTEVGRQIGSAERARALVDATGHPGYVEYWSERTQRRVRVATRSDEGCWTTTNPFTGEEVPR
jgi:hypothetical protein